MSPALEKSRQGNGECNEVSKSKVTVVGSGNWGSVAAKLIASNALKLPSFHGKFENLGSFSLYDMIVDLGLCHYHLNERLFLKNSNFIG